MSGDDGRTWPIGMYGDVVGEDLVAGPIGMYGDVVGDGRTGSVADVCATAAAPMPGMMTAVSAIQALSSLQRIAFSSRWVQP